MARYSLVPYGGNPCRTRDDLITVILVAFLGASLVVTWYLLRATTLHPSPDSPRADTQSTHSTPDAPAPERAGPRSGSLPTSDAAPADWRAQIAQRRHEKNVVALQAIAESSLGRDAHERALLLADTTAALASIGGDDARRAFDDLLSSPRRDVRLAAMNAAAVAFPEERAALLVAWAGDPDPLIQAKAKALREALR